MGKFINSRVLGPKMALVFSLILYQNKLNPQKSAKIRIRQIKAVW
jgi:hypothetical protein